MNLVRNQQTVSQPCRVSGRGYWSGDPVQVVIRPAAVDSGVQLVRSDLPGSPACRVSSEFRVDTQLRTNFRCGDASVQMVEHLMAALCAMQVDNCSVEIDAEELPGLDGSCFPYVEAIVAAGVQEQSARKPRLVIDQTVRVESGDRWIEARPPEGAESHYSYRLGFDGPSVIASQDYAFDLDPVEFAREVAPARTFVTEAQASVLRTQGVASHVTNRDLLVFGTDGPIGNELRFENECARHKTLDLIGDLAVSGVELIGRFVSHRGGHSLNGRLAEALSAIALKKGLKKASQGGRSSSEALRGSRSA